MEQYPRMLHKPDGSKLIVQDVEAEHDAVGKGWQLHATPPHQPGPAVHAPVHAPQVAPVAHPVAHPAAHPVHEPAPPVRSPEPDEDEARKRRR